MPPRSSRRSRPWAERPPRSPRILSRTTPATTSPRPSPPGQPIDILVLNASIELPEDFQAITREHFDRQIAVNLRTTLELLQALVPPMAERGWGRVVTIGSVQQERPHPAMLVYAGTKAAQLNWVLSLARQFGGQGVTVNNLAPGAILTARNRDQMAIEGEALAQPHPRRPTGPAGRSGGRRDAAVLRRRPLYQRGQPVRRWRTHGGVANAHATRRMNATALLIASRAWPTNSVARTKPCSRP